MNIIHLFIDYFIKITDNIFGYVVTTSLICYIISYNRNVIHYNIGMVLGKK